jgi:hypothetical protein
MGALAYFLLSLIRRGALHISKVDGRYEWGFSMTNMEARNYDLRIERMMTAQSRGT